MQFNKPFEHILPEEAGLSSRAILAFLDELEEKRVVTHAVQILRYGKLLAEGYYAPFTADTQHRIYSISKSFVSLAIGILAGEGKLSLDDKIVDHWPEKVPENVHPYIAATTIRDMLKMTSPHNTSAYKVVKDDDWVRTFFTCPPCRRPGTVFVYETTNATVLSALVEKLTGKTIIEFLYERLFTPMECSAGIHSAMLPTGIAWGGAGFICTPRDLAKVAQLCLNGGVWEGKQLVPAEYIKEATSKQQENNLSSARWPDQRQGYGYQIWRCSHNGFSFLGMGAQVAICLPDRDLVVVVNGDNQLIADDYHRIFTSLWSNIYDNLSDTPLPEDPEGNAELARRLASLQVITAEGDAKKPEEIPFETGRWYTMDENRAGFTKCRFTFTEDGGTFEYERTGVGHYALPFGYGKQVQHTFDGMPAISSAGWHGDRYLQLCTFIIGDSPAPLEIGFCFEDDAVTLIMRNGSEGLLDGMAFVGYSGAFSGQFTE